MIGLIKQVFAALLSFSKSLASKYVSSNNELHITRATLIDLNSVQLNYYPFMIGLVICDGNCNAFDNLSIKVCVPSKTKDVNVEAFNMTKRINEAKTLVKHISRDCQCKSDSTTCNSNKKWNNEKCQCGCEKYCTCAKSYSWNRSTSICENRNYYLYLFLMIQKLYVMKL